MKAALVTSFAEPPRYADVPEPVPVAGAGDVLVEVLASGLHPRIRSQADGSHYTSGDALPLVPGLDGVGRTPDGRLAYFVLGDTPLGAMAEKTLVDPRRMIPLPDDADPVLIAAAMNPAMSSWVAFRRRVTFEPGMSVLILGATGSAGQLAVQIARHLGARDIVAAGRGQERLDALRPLGATATIDLAAAPDAVAAEISAKAAEVDVVIDYLWGEPAQNAIMPLLLGRADRSRLVEWVQIGSVAGADIALGSAALRQANIRFLGSGQGSNSAAGIVAELPSLVAELVAGTFTIDADGVPLAEVTRVWQEPATRRVVLLP
ncbi:quinone oxidoreductase family protein [Frondihabitans australicus]|uniref:NADPH:quinone reductase-like Zn-dependent oxidoreductase n=1 Tax=Frondihabitans australicus TaxID=386892 RepID=A0A495IAC7_9MICO|nr:zinc-binding alcohol dehydrogenase family protein [Frondihabitans australicus]RKR72973.1 NADPH:quinone reductase-like Zn-dependent oxidoreductase [Frondihabitans australicus]